MDGGREWGPSYVARDARAAVALQGVIELPGGNPLDARIGNLSLGGFFATCACAPPIGAGISLFVPELGRFACQVRWALGPRFGAIFTAAPDARQKAAIQALLDEQPGEEEPIAA